MKETVWVLNYLEDLESDFSAIHRVDDMYALDSDKFFRLANRLWAYKGVIRAHAEAEAQNSQPTPTARLAYDVTEIEATPVALAADPVFAQFASEVTE